MRQGWDEYFLDLAEKVATRSTCDRLHVGAVIVKDKNIIATGYNGSASGMPHCDDVGHLLVNGRCERTIHAEQNAIIQAAKHGTSIEGAEIYVTHSPCYTCSKFIISAGIKRVICGSLYSKDDVLGFLHEGKVDFELIERIEHDN